LQHASDFRFPRLLSARGPEMARMCGYSLIGRYPLPMREGWDAPC
jgi:hypothetical protein